MKKLDQKLGFVAQNVILGTLTGSMVAYNLRLLFTRIGGTDLVWILFVLLGPALGYLSGKERQRMERLKLEKQKVEEDLTKIQKVLKSSAKKYRLLVEQANDAIFLTTVKGRFLFFNEATCVLSGYSKGELKNMSISQLQMDEHLSEQTRKAWLDNGICRYEETWKNKSGDEVFLEINSRWIQYREHQLILHVGRDVIRQSVTNQGDRVQAIRHLQESEVMEISSVLDKLYKLIKGPLSETKKLIQHLQKEYPQESEKLTDVLAHWGNTEKIMQWLPSKNARDLRSTPCRWDLNEMLRQELVYLQIVTGIKGFVKKTLFASGLPLVFGFGRDYSMAFGTVFKAALESVKDSERPEFSISTRDFDDHNLVEIQMEESVPFKECLCKITDPFFKEDDSTGRGKTEMGFLACQSLFESLGAKMDVGEKEGGGKVIRIRVPGIGSDEEPQKVPVAEDSEHSLIM